MNNNLNKLPTDVINMINEYSPSTWNIRIYCNFNENQAAVENEEWPPNMDAFNDAYDEDDWLLIGEYNHNVYVHFEIPIEMYNKYNLLRPFEQAIERTAIDDNNENRWVYGSDSLLQDYVDNGEGDINVVAFVEPGGEGFNGVERENDNDSIEYIVNFQYNVDLPGVMDEERHQYTDAQWNNIINTIQWHTAENMSRFCREFLPVPGQANNIPPNPHNLARWKLQNVECFQADWWRKAFNNQVASVLPVQNNTAVNVMGNWLVNEQPILKF